VGKKTLWKVKAKSNLPREVFFKTIGFIQQAIKRYGKESIEDVMAAGRKGLERAGEAFGCEIKNGAERADVYWSVDERLLIAWQIHEERLNAKRARKLKGSKALLRLVVVIRESGWFRIFPQSTRREAL
jgi:hypothetical protein